MQRRAFIAGLGSAALAWPHARTASTAISAKPGTKLEPLRTARNSMRGRPFKKGESGNPGGRPKVTAELRALARVHAPDAIKELVRLAIKAKNETARVAAIRELLDRGYGKPAQAQVVETEPDSDSGKSAEQLQAEIFAELAEMFPDYRFVPVKPPNTLADPKAALEQARMPPAIPRRRRLVA
jgi:hypothetical protein